LRYGVVDFSSQGTRRGSRDGSCGPDSTSPSDGAGSGVRDRCAGNYSEIGTSAQTKSTGSFGEKGQENNKAIEAGRRERHDDVDSECRCVIDSITMAGEERWQEESDG
jgi:hypothetical protein